MAKAANVPAKFLYRGVNLTGVDIRGQNLADLDLTGADLSNAIMDRSTLIDPKYDPRLELGSIRRTIRLPRNLYICVRVLEAELNYIYTGWAIKWLIEAGYRESIGSGQTAAWTNWYAASASAQNLMSQHGGNDYSLKINLSHYEYLSDSYRHLGGVSKAIRFSILIGMFYYWNADSEDVGSGNILEFLQRVQKRTKADATLLSLARNWQE